MLRLVFAGAIAVAAVGAAVAAVPASADPLCTSVSTSGTLVGTHSVGPKCVPYPLAAECNTTSTGLGTLANVTESTCVPAP